MFLFHSVRIGFQRACAARAEGFASIPTKRVVAGIASDFNFPVALSTRTPSISQSIYRAIDSNPKRFCSKSANRSGYSHCGAFQRTPGRPGVHRPSRSEAFWYCLSVREFSVILATRVRVDVCSTFRDIRERTPGEEIRCAKRQFTEKRKIGFS